MEGFPFTNGAIPDGSSGRSKGWHNPHLILEFSAEDGSDFFHDIRFLDISHDRQLFDQEVICRIQDFSLAKGELFFVF